MQEIRVQVPVPDWYSSLKLYCHIFNSIQLSNDDLKTHWQCHSRQGMLKNSKCLTIIDAENRIASLHWQWKHQRTSEKHTNQHYRLLLLPFYTMKLRSNNILVTYTFQLAWKIKRKAFEYHRATIDLLNTLSICMCMYVYEWYTISGLFGLKCSWLTDYICIPNSIPKFHIVT